MAETSIIAAHDTIDAAAAQKVEALVGRGEPQTRDLYDLNLLLDRGAKLPALSARSLREARAARSRQALTVLGGPT